MKHGVDQPDRFAGSRAHQARASLVMPRGVSSSPRASQRPVPIVIARAEGAHITDVDGNSYIDYGMGYGPLILGHTPHAVFAALEREMALGLRTGSVNRNEVELAERLAHHVPGAAQSVFLSSGTEACQLALRLARATTGRLTIVKFRYHYHGWSDAIDVATQADNDGPATGGQDPDALRNVAILDWGDADGLETLLRGEVAGVIMEAAAINGGCFAPPPGFLERARALTREHGAVLIFDEVITGFRLGLGGAQARYGVTPDITVLGKALGAGIPISAVSGSAAMLEPLVCGLVMQRGTYNGNPLSTAAAVACVDHLAAHADEYYPRMHRYAETIAAHVRDTAQRAGAAVAANCVGPCVQIFAGTDSVPTLSDVTKVDRDATLRLTERLLHAGVAALPRGLMYISTAHGDDDIDRTLDALTHAVKASS